MFNCYISYNGVVHFVFICMQVKLACNNNSSNKFWLRNIDFEDFDTKMQQHVSYAGFIIIYK